MADMRAHVVRSGAKLIDFLWKSVRPYLSRFVRFTNIAYLEAKSDYEGTMLGIAWMPLSTLAFSIVIAVVLRSPSSGNVTQFFLYVFAGYVCWQFISDSIAKSTNIIQSKFDFAIHSGLSLGALFGKLVVDRLFELGMNLIVLSVAVVLLSPLSLGWPLLLLPVLIVLLSVTSAAVSYMVNLVTLMLPDLENLIRTSMRLLFFATPIFWGAPAVIDARDPSHPIRIVLEQYNPAAYYLKMLRQIYGVESLDWSVWGIGIAITLGLTLSGYWLFERTNGFVRNLK